jgi:hypothetical protein
MIRKILTYLLGMAAAVAPLHAQTPYKSSEDFARYAMKLRESALLNMEPRVVVPTSRSRYPWKLGIVTTTFWVGENASKNNPVHNKSSSWDLNWADNFGGYDNPDRPPALRMAASTGPRISFPGRIHFTSRFPTMT